MESLKRTWDLNKKKIVALIVALIIGALGITVSPATQESIVDGVTSVLPDLNDKPVEPTQE